jgi:hypothetical protein
MPCLVWRRAASPFFAAGALLILEVSDVDEYGMKIHVRLGIPGAKWLSTAAFIILLLFERVEGRASRGACGFRAPRVSVEWRPRCALPRALPMDALGSRRQRRSRTANRFGQDPRHVRAEDAHLHLLGWAPGEEPQDDRDAREPWPHAPHDGRPRLGRRRRAPFLDGLQRRGNPGVGSRRSLRDAALPPSQWGRLSRLGDRNVASLPMRSIRRDPLPAARCRRDESRSRS